MAYAGLSQHVNFDSMPEPSGRFTLEELVGEGTYGEVYAARDEKTGDKVAVKIMENVADNIEEIEEEYFVLRDLSLHPNIPLFHGLFLRRAKPPQDEDQLWFVMEVTGDVLKYHQIFPNNYVNKLLSLVVHRRLGNRFGSRFEETWLSFDRRSNSLYSS